jgi:glycosyltransferase involved in cell wall biosynthesis
MRVTVAICTWNRSDLLDQTLTGLRHLRIPAGVEWELLVVNNHCTDATDEVISRHAPHLPLRRVYEPQQGLSHARNRAVAEAAGELLVWTDDDVLVDEGWLEAYVRASADWPGASFFGGPVAPWFAVPPPGWVARNIDLLACMYAIKQLTPEVRPLAPDEFPAGANMTFRTEALRSYAFNPSMGRSGSRLFGGEELDVFERLRAAGGRGVWVGTACVKHFIPPQRLTRAYLREWQWGCGRTLVRGNAGCIGKRVWGVPRWALRRYAVSTLKAWCFRLWDERRWLRAFLDAAHARGVMAEARAARGAVT